MIGNHRNRKTAITGFTLIELMVVMLLISIMLAVAIPRFDGSFLQNPIKKVSRKLISTVRLLRSTAVQTQKQHSLVIDLDNQRFYMLSTSMEPQDRTSTAEKAFKMPDSLVLVDVQMPNSEPISTGVAEIQFYPAGYSDYALIRLENSSEERFTYVVQPLLPKVKRFDEWLEV